MIQLAFPRPDEDLYMFRLGVLFGPFDKTLLYTGEKVSFNSRLTTMEQRKGLYHENFVEHHKLNGTLEYHPLMNGITRAPTVQRPFQLRIPVWDGYGQASTWGAYAGMAGFESSTYSLTSSSQYAEHVATTRNPTTGLWSTWEVSTSNSMCQAPGVVRHDFISLSLISKYDCSYNLRTRRRSYFNAIGGVGPVIDWRKQQSFQTITGLTDYAAQCSESFWNQTVYILKVRIPSSVFSIGTAKEQIDAIVSSIFPEKFPIKDTNYGDLAMLASERTNHNRVNMIAFLRDLREPLQLIPKLRNLNKLKELVVPSLKQLKSLRGSSSAFLGVKYGLLPTVSDLKAIRSALERLAPYVDRNGFQTYSAGKAANLYEAQLGFRLEQHIKLAIADEDSLLQNLITRLESAGVWPTFENLWDLVPYSFVLDWFIDVGALLERVDTNLRLERLNIRYVTMSRKTLITGQVNAYNSKYPFLGTIEWEHYHRWVSDQCPLPPLSLQKNEQPFNHWLEAGALITQRT